MHSVAIDVRCENKILCESCRMWKWFKFASQFSFQPTQFLIFGFFQALLSSHHNSIKKILFKLLPINTLMRAISIAVKLMQSNYLSGESFNQDIKLRFHIQEIHFIYIKMFYKKMGSKQNYYDCYYVLISEVTIIILRCNFEFLLKIAQSVEKTPGNPLNHQFPVAVANAEFSKSHKFICASNKVFSQKHHEISDNF